MTKFLYPNKLSAFTRLFILFIFLSTIAIFSSCSPSRPSSYFRDLKKDTLLTVAPKVEDELTIRTGDILTITVSSLNKEEDLLYNSEAAAGYEVSKEGTIHFHRLGKLPVLGLTRKQAKQKLEEGLAPYLKDPLASVRFSNHFITLIGDLGAPRVVPMPDERISIIDALAMGGNITETTLLSDVIVIRDSSTTQKKIKHINLESNQVFASDYYYLQPNDVVVLNPNEKTIMEDRRRQRYQQISSLVLQVITIGLVVYQTFFRK